MVLAIVDPEGGPAFLALLPRTGAHGAFFCNNTKYFVKFTESQAFR